MGRTEEDGTGYGLSGAKDAVERIANGSMDVRSATGKGTIFMVIVPLRSASSGMTDRQSQATSPDRTTQDAKSGAEQGGIHFGGINVETVNQAELQQLPFYKSRIEPYLGQIDLQNFNGFSFEIISIQKVSKRDLLS